MELSDTSYGDTKVPWNSMECSMEFHGTKWYVIWWHQSSMEFHGIFHGIPWNTCVICNGAFLIPWNPMELGDFLFGDSRVPWNSMEYPLEVQPGLNAIIWRSQTSMEFHGTKWYFIWRHQNSMEFHGMFRGIPWFFIWQLQSSLEFHWIWLGSPARVKCHKMSMSKYHGIPWS